MNASTFTLAVGDAHQLLDAPGDWNLEVVSCDDLPQAQAAILKRAPDALVMACESVEAALSVLTWPGLSQACTESGVVVALPQPTPELARRLLRAGVQDVVECGADRRADLSRTVWLAAQRKRNEQELRRAGSIDLTTGLPNQAHLADLLSQMCALREREPARMAVLVFRMEGLAATRLSWGADIGLTLKRKVAVRLRASLRASDAVCALGHDAFAVLLTRVDTPQTASQVQAKLLGGLSQPYSVGGQPLQVSLAPGVAVYPDDGRDADTLMHCAMGRSGQVQGSGRGRFGEAIERNGAQAANDD